MICAENIQFEKRFHKYWNKFDVANFNCKRFWNVNLADESTSYRESQESDDSDEIQVY